jgi:hypothetical protein
MSFIHGSGKTRFSTFGGQNMCNYRETWHEDQKIEKINAKLEVLCPKLGIEAVYRCDANWVGGNAVLLEATRDTAQLKKGEFLIIGLG